MQKDYTIEEPMPTLFSRPDLILGFQRGDPTQNDAYFSTILRFGWRLNNQTLQGKEGNYDVLFSTNPTKI